MFFTRLVSRKCSNRVSKVNRDRKRQLFFEPLEERRVLALINFVEGADIGNPGPSFTVDTAGANTWSGNIGATPTDGQDQFTVNLASGFQIDHIQFQFTDNHLSSPSTNWFVESTQLPFNITRASGGSVDLTDTGFTVDPTLPSTTSSFGVLINTDFAVASNPWTLTLTVSGTALGVAPSVTANPSDVAIDSGQAAIFTAAATGTPTPTVKWQEDSGGGFVDISNGTFGGVTYSGATTTTLSVTPSSSSASGRQYRAVFTNPSGSATTAAATMTVASLSASLDGSGNLVISDTDPAGKDNVLSVKVVGNLLTVSDANFTFGTAPPGWTLSPDGKSISILASA